MKTSGTRTNTRKYYAFAGTNIAMRDNETLTWLLQDQVNSTSVTADASGNLLSEVRYTAFGEVRSGESLTDYQYTGQRNELEIGLYYYVARFYDPQLAHFISADSVVPEPYDVKSFDRYGYSENNPINYFDPTGHMLIEDDRISCQSKKCLDSDYFWGKLEFEYYQRHQQEVQRILNKNGNKSSASLVPQSLFEPKIGVQSLDYDFFEKKRGNETSDLSNIEYPKMMYDTGVEMKWWKPIPLLSETVTAVIQVEKDKDKGFSIDTQIKRVGVVIIEDAVVSNLASGASILATIVTAPSGFASVVVGASIYWDVTLVLSSPMDNINNDYLFPLLNIDQGN